MSKENQYNLRQYCYKLYYCILLCISNIDLIVGFCFLKWNKNQYSNDTHTGTHVLYETESA